MAKNRSTIDAYAFDDDFPSIAKPRKGRGGARHKTTFTYDDGIYEAVRQCAFDNRENHGEVINRALREHLSRVGYL